MHVLQAIIVLFFAVNALFWGLFSHAAHCKLAGAFGVKQCPPHIVHLVIGLVSFIAAVAVAQWGYLSHLLS